MADLSITEVVLCESLEGNEPQTADSGLGLGIGPDFGAGLASHRATLARHAEALNLQQSCRSRDMTVLLCVC